MSLNVVRLGVNYRFGEVRTVQALGYAPQGPSRYPASWTGVYVGVHGGYASGLQSLEPFAGALASPHQNGGFGGFQSGANWQFARNWLVGLEADSSWGSINGNENGARAKIDSLGTARGRLGYIMNNWMFYGTAGLAWAHSEAFVPADTAHDRFLLGWAAGMGVEYAFSDRWSLKLEYLYTDFFSNQSSVNTNSEAQTADLHIVKFGINYRASILELIGWR
jgi:outer membrane immunogenic protein